MKVRKEATGQPIPLDHETVCLFRQLCKHDLYFLLRYVCQRPDADSAFVFQRCREVQADPDGQLDLWARYHYKSSIITFALTIQEILSNPDITIAIFSFSIKRAGEHYSQIKRELEVNEWLLLLFPDILWEDTRKAPRWTEEEGLIVQRGGNPKEPTLSAWGLTNQMPTGSHFDLRIYDDVVTIDSVTTPEMIQKTTLAYRLSHALGKEGGRLRLIGTRYHYNDTYGTIIDEKLAPVRKYSATDDDKVDGEPRLLSKAALSEIRVQMGPYIFACQMMQDPRADSSQGFDGEWLRTYDSLPEEVAPGANIYITVDPAGEKKKGSDYTVMWVWALGQDRNYYLVDGVRDRLRLTKRADNLFALHRKWNPIAVGYERYGMMADVQHMLDRMEREKYRFEIVELGGQVEKHDRIRRLIPIFEQHRVYMPGRLLKMNEEGEMYDFVQIFKDQEYGAFPVAAHDDMLDAASRILDADLGAVHPMPVERFDHGAATKPDDDYNPFEAA